MSNGNGGTTTPLLKQYREIKANHRDAILFFRMGDFYEMFFEDAEIGARALNITLTSRGDGVPLAGVPVKAATEYLKQLLQAGHRVAICEQVEDPKAARGIVRREVVETLTPGAMLEDGWLPGGRNNFLVALASDSAGGEAPDVGIAAIDLSTGDFVLETASAAGLAEVLGRLNPAELLLPAGSTWADLPNVMQTRREAWEFDSELGYPELSRRFGIASLDGLGITPADRAAVAAAGALIRYLGDLQPGGIPHLARPVVRRPEAYMWVDEMTRRNLELVEPLRGDARGVTLLENIDATVTPMGARCLRRWLLSPLSDPDTIRRRHDAVELFVKDERGRDSLRAALNGVRDLERLGGRAAAGRATPRELGALRDSLLRLPGIHDALRALRGAETDALLTEQAAAFDPLDDLATLLAAGLEDRLPVSLGDGGVIRQGHDAELDESRALRDGGKQYIAGLQQRERERTGIPSLKVGYNKVFGYYLEVTHTHTARIPADYERRQTLTTAERYVTPELKEYEAKVLGAEERMTTREAELFGALRTRAGEAVGRIRNTARVLARLDVLADLADIAVRHQYVRPEITADFDLTLTACRHAVVERMMARESFIPNDVHFDASARVLLVTGPNMAGKSTILRQIGLAVILAQMGSFIPADAGRIGVVDRLFTRVGASDNLARGQSTFMVEMAETSAILHNATPRSLVLLDEIGRGTSTYDGVAIAWAVTEHLHDHAGCKTMFATHYHELMQLPERLAHARNFNVAVRETSSTVVFLHRLEPGGTDRSYGIHVAQLAGLPRPVVSRATEILGQLEGEHRMVPGTPLAVDPGQLPLFASGPDPLVTELQGIDVESLTPLQALNRLADLQRRAGRPS